MLSFAAGIGLGLLYFGGLWLTILRLTASQNPWHLMVGSWLLRLSIALVGFYFLLDRHWTYLLFGLAGFAIARLILTFCIVFPLDLTDLNPTPSPSNTERS